MLENEGKSKESKSWKMCCFQRARARSFVDDGQW